MPTKEETIKEVRKFNVADFNFRCSCGKILPIIKGTTEAVIVKFELQEDASMDIKCECGREISLYVTVSKNIRG